MLHRALASLVISTLAGCADPSVWRPSVGVADPDGSGEPTATSATSGSTDPLPDDPVPVPDLEVQFLAVGGYLMRFGDDVVMTPPLYTNPDVLETTFGDVASDPDLVARFAAGVRFDQVDAVLVGHAHYDHLLDLPTIWPETDDALIYGNETMAHVLAAYAPDRPPECTSEPQPFQVPRERVVAVDALTDFSQCPGLGEGDGEWIAVEGTNVRVRALCSIHPDQVGPIHFGLGRLDEDLCDPPQSAWDWVEGLTLAWLVDFLDPETGAPLYRVYYQDAPSNPPVGLFAPELLDEKAVDVALLNVGNYTAVEDHPGATLELMAPRYTVGGHWEDFFRTQDWPLVPIVGHDVDEYGARAEAAMVGDELPVRVRGAVSTDRQWVPDPGTLFEFPHE